ncbi:HpcH/HpaI aldolase family protein [Bradyrhizobium iriomotense]|uniref:HpcH/HpaI aldolase family protein n=1 Tax=Bradyrhizobium iriomotense TaxID=441950 RepID=UPI001B8A5000|nr:aldolase/citrate lyase family protein [Bradyrhizobium iriomotense]MBR0783028.1 2,4-dihydroxyhept-2-ene-1,7-dioic acid aldolase [Bradyrhizobium iriomotense]
MSELALKIRTSFICTIPSAVVTQALAQAGADAVVIDQEHGAIGPEALHAMIASTAGTRCRPVVRVGKRDEAMVKLALDMGAAGIVFPQVRTAQEAAECVAMTRYPPRGTRGFGPFIGHSRWNVSFEDYLAKVGDTIVCNILIETKAAIENIEAICAVEGISALVLAPFDLSVELDCPGQFEDPSFLKAVEAFERATTAAKVPRSTLALTDEQVRSAIARGYAAVALGFDVLMLKNAAAVATGWARQA